MGKIVDIEFSGNCQISPPSATLRFTVLLKVRKGGKEKKGRKSFVAVVANM